MGRDLVREDATCQVLARHASINNANTAAGITVLVNKLKFCWWNSGQPRRIDAEVGTVDFDHEVEAFTEVDSDAGG